MTTQTNTNPESPHAWALDKFSEPRTMPARWDLSELMAPARMNGASPQAAEPTRSTAAAPAEEAVEPAGPEWRPNPFPEPRTYPASWDLSL